MKDIEWVGEIKEFIGPEQIREDADNAVKLSFLLLGDRAQEGVIEAQARAFMTMSSHELKESVLRFELTENLYLDVPQVPRAKNTVRANISKRIRRAIEL